MEDSKQMPPRYDEINAPQPSHIPDPSSSKTDLTISTDGLFIQTIPISNSIDKSPEKLYQLTASLFTASGFKTIQISRLYAASSSANIIKDNAEIKDTKMNTPPLLVYAISQEFISPLHSKAHILQHLQVKKSHSMSWSHIKLFWDFSAIVEMSHGGVTGDKGMATIGGSNALGYDGSTPGLTTKHLLQAKEGEWVNEGGEVLAVERMGTEGIPILSVMKSLDAEGLDLLVSAWCVRWWGEAGKKMKKASK